MQTVKKVTKERPSAEETQMLAALNRLLNKFFDYHETLIYRTMKGIDTERARRAEEQGVEITPDSHQTFSTLSFGDRVGDDDLVGYLSCGPKDRDEVWDRIKTDLEGNLAIVDVSLPFFIYFFGFVVFFVLIILALWSFFFFFLLFGVLRH